MEIIMKNLRKKISDSFFEPFLFNWGKNEDEDKRNWENEFGFWILFIKIRLYGNFRENQCENIFDPFYRPFLTNQGKNENYENTNKKILENESDFWILHMKISLCGN